MEGFKQGDKTDSTRIVTGDEQNHDTILAVKTVKKDYVQLPKSLNDFIKDHTDAIGTGLYYLALYGVKPELEIELDKLKGKAVTTRFSLSAVAQNSLDDLKRLGLTKKKALAVQYLKTKPSTILRVKL